MMGKKKLATIRQELREALVKDGKDPMRWLEDSIAAGQRLGSGTEVLESLKRVLERDTSANPGSGGPR